MSKRFIATILAGAIAITSISAQPVQAGNDDLKKFLLGATALVIIGTAIEQNRKEMRKQNKPKVVQHRPVHQPKVIHQPREIHHHKPQRPHKPKAHRRAALPEYCLRTVQGYNGQRVIYGNRCLRNNYAQSHALPQDCRIRIEGPRGTRVGYRPRCLYRNGFRG